MKDLALKEIIQLVQDNEYSIVKRANDYWNLMKTTKADMYKAIDSIVAKFLEEKLQTKVKDNSYVIGGNNKFRYVSIFYRGDSIRNFCYEVTLKRDGKEGYSVASIKPCIEVYDNKILNETLMQRYNSILIQKQIEKEMNKKELPVFIEDFEKKMSKTIAEMKEGKELSINKYELERLFDKYNRLREK